MQEDGGREGGREGWYWEAAAARRGLHNTLGAHVCANVCKSATPRPSVQIRHILVMADQGAIGVSALALSDCNFVMS